MPPAICQNFVQNAWKKELCSNCFKLKDEHATPPPKVIRPIAFVSSSRIDGIIKTPAKKAANSSGRRNSKKTVSFTKDLTEVIGVGGEDWNGGADSDEEGEECDGEGDSEDSEDSLVGPEEDGNSEESARELKRITKENTDFNTTGLKHEAGDSNGNAVKRVYTQLLLGKPVVDASGKKQTLLVSVTPFGEDSSTTKRSAPPKILSHIPISKSTKETVPETKPPVVLTSYTKNEDERRNNNNNNSREEKSLLDEITETLENGKNPIQILPRKKIQKEIVLSVVGANNNYSGCNNNNSGSLNSSGGGDNNNGEANGIEQKNKAVEETQVSPEVTNKCLNGKVTSPERKIGLSRTPALKRDQEKPVVYQTSTAKIELLNTKNLILSSKAMTNGLLHHHNGTKRPKEEAANQQHPPPAATGATTSPISPKTRDQMPDAKSKKQGEEFAQSREQAGEPDGRADPDSPAEPPALPSSPPPLMETQSSFLHNSPPIYDKPKILTKPAVLVRKPPVAPPLSEEVRAAAVQQQHHQQQLEEERLKLSKQDSNASDVDARLTPNGNNNNKRRAPRPPEDTYANVNGNSPVLRTEVVLLRDKEKRASSCTPPKATPVEFLHTVPEPAPRKFLSTSTDCLLATGYNDKRNGTIKEKAKGRFSLKRFLRIGSSKDLHRLSLDSVRDHEDRSCPKDMFEVCPPLPKPRLVIVHPSELNGAKVEVVTKPPHEYEAVYVPKAQKPPPPPRNLDEWSSKRPQHPHPPKSVDVKQKQYVSSTLPFPKKTETVYANIGEVRSAIVPNKPQRTASMRERECQEQQERQRAIANASTNASDYEPVNLTANGGRDSADSSSSSMGENIYNDIKAVASSSPVLQNPFKATPPNGKLKARSESNTELHSSDYYRYSNIPKSVSMTYCGSETESEIYSPYSYYGSETEVTEDDHDWIQNGRTHKLRSRKGRSIVHKNLEDNYGAVIVANHEALAQVLENIQQTSHVQPSLRYLKSLPNLRWTDFSIKSAAEPLVVGCRVFHQALWGTQHVTLAVTNGTTPSPTTLPLGTCSLTAVTEFSDLIPSKFVTRGGKQDGDKQLQVTVSVLPWLQVSTLQQYAESLEARETEAFEETWKEAAFVLLQLVNALKTLQAQGIEELSLSLNSFVLCKEVDKDVHQRLCVMHGLGEESHVDGGSESYGTLCMVALRAVGLLQPIVRLDRWTLLQSLLSNEKAVTLTQVKSILEFCLWGPSDVALGTTIPERELALQRWLDLQRATVLHGLVCTRIQLTVHEECHLLFLVRSTARMMSDASLLLESSNMRQQHLLTNGHHK